MSADEQLALCEMKRVMVEDVLRSRGIAIASATPREAETDHVKYDDRQFIRADRIIEWGTATALRSSANPCQDVHAWFFIRFKNRNGVVVQIVFNPVRKRWASDLTTQELQIIDEALLTEESDPDRLAREIRAGRLADNAFTQEIDTKLAMEVVDLLAKWSIEIEGPKPSQTLIGSSRRRR